MAGNCIIDDDVSREASLNEIVRRYFSASATRRPAVLSNRNVSSLELLMNQAGIALGEREVEKRAHAMRPEATDGQPVAAIELADGAIVTGKTGLLLGAASSALLNALKKLAGIDQETGSGFRPRHRTDPDAQDELPRQQEPAPAHRRDSDRPVQLGLRK